MCNITCPPHSPATSVRTCLKHQPQARWVVRVDQDEWCCLDMNSKGQQQDSQHIVAWRQALKLLFNLYFLSFFECLILFRCLVLYPVQNFSPWTLDPCCWTHHSWITSVPLNPRQRGIGTALIKRSISSSAVLLTGWRKTIKGVVSVFKVEWNISLLF